MTLRVITTPTNVGLHTSAMLMAPGGLESVLASGHSWIPRRELRTMIDVGGQFDNALKPYGHEPKIASALTSYRKARPYVFRSWGRAYIEPLAYNLGKIPEEHFRAAADRVIESMSICFDQSPKAKRAASAVAKAGERLERAGAESAGLYVHAMLLEPSGFFAGIDTHGRGISWRDMRELMDVASLLERELREEGHAINLVEELDNYWWQRHDPIFRKIYLEQAGYKLRAIPADTFRKVVERVAASLELRFDATGKKARRMKALMKQRTWTVWLLVKIFGRWDWQEKLAERLIRRGKVDEARNVYRKLGFNHLQKGMRNIGFSRSSEQRGRYDLSAFQLAMAIGVFEQSARAFERADSELNIVKVRTLIGTLRAEIRVLNEKISQEETGCSRMTVRGMLKELAMPVEAVSDAEIVHYARYAALGSPDGIERFLRRTGEIMDSTAEKVLHTLTVAEGDDVGRIAHAFRKDAPLYQRIKKAIGDDRLFENVVRQLVAYQSTGNQVIGNR